MHTDFTMTQMQVIYHFAKGIIMCVHVYNAPSATAATVKSTKVLRRRKALALSLVMEHILLRAPEARFCRALRRWRRPRSERSGLSESSCRNRLVLVGGFSFIISSRTWSRRQVSWETEGANKYDMRYDKYITCLYNNCGLLRGINKTVLTYLDIYIILSYCKDFVN